MVDVMDKPPTIPPRNPVRQHGGGRGVIILPCLLHVAEQTIITDPTNNWRTVIYQWMDRVTGDDIFDPSATWETSHTAMREYRSWLETYETESGLPPHIAFAGAIKPLAVPDLTFYPRWLKYAKRKFW